MPEVKIILEVDDKGTVKIKQFSDQSKKSFDEMKKGAEQTKGPLAAISEGWVGLVAKLTAATAAVYGISKAISSFVNEAAEAEQIENRLRFALETTGYTWKYAKTAVDQFANSIQESTRFSDEQARQALTDMMMYTNDFAKAQMGAKLAMDMSIRTGQDFHSTSRLIGMAMSGNVEMLGRYIPELRNLDERLGSNATNAQKAEYAMKILNEKFGGTAQADMNTYSGTVAKFKNAWSDLKETIGYGLLPVLKEMFEWLTKIINAFQGFSPESASQKVFDATIEKFKSRIAELKEIASQPGLVSFQKEMIASQIAALDAELKKLEVISQKREEAASKLTAERKTDILPSGIKTKEKEEDLLSAYNSVIQKANEWGEVVVARQELTELGWIKEKDSVEQVLEELTRLEREANEWGEVTVGRQELIEAGWKKAAEELKKSGQMLDEMGKTFGDTLISNMVTLMSATDDWGEKFKSVGTSVLQTIMQIIAKQLIMNALFENSSQGTGFLSKGSGLGSIVSGLLGSFQTGTDYVPRTGPYLLHEGETVTPKGAGVNNYYIDARGSQRGVSAEIMRAIKASENRAVIRSVNQVVDNKMRGGRFAKTFES